MAKRKKSSAKSREMNNRPGSPRADLKRRVGVLVAFTFVPGLLVYVIGLLWIMEYDIRLLWYAVSMALAMTGFIGEMLVQARWSELVSGYLNYLVLLFLGVFVALQVFNWVLFLNLLLILTVFYLIVVAGVGLRKWSVK